MKTLRSGEWAKLWKTVWRTPFADWDKERRQKLVRGCKGKAIYETWHEAKAVMDTLPARSGVVLNVYRCRVCSEFHIGNSRFRKKVQF